MQGKLNFLAWNLILSFLQISILSRRKISAGVTSEFSQVKVAGTGRFWKPCIYQMCPRLTTYHGDFWQVLKPLDVSNVSETYIISWWLLAGFFKPCMYTKCVWNLHHIMMIPFLCPSMFKHVLVNSLSWLVLNSNVLVVLQPFLGVT